MIDVVSLNCWKDEGDLAARVTLIGDGLAALDADIICLQEVYAAPGGCVARTLAKRLDLCCAAHPARAKERHGVVSTSGLAVLSRWKILYAEALELPQLEEDGQRIAQGVTLDTPYGPVGVLNLHLTHIAGATGAAMRALQLETALSWMQRAPQPLCIVAGDFNAALDDEEIDAFLRRHGPDFGPEDICRVPTLRHEPAKAVDHIAILAGATRWRLEERQTVLDAPTQNASEWPSDHLGVRVRITSH